MKTIFDETSVFGDFGVAHISVIHKLSEMHYPQARRFLKALWFTKGEQTEMIRIAKEYATQNKIRSPLLLTVLGPKERWQCLDQNE